MSLQDYTFDLYQKIIDCFAQKFGVEKSLADSFLQEIWSGKSNNNQGAVVSNTKPDTTTNHEPNTGTNPNTDLKISDIANHSPIQLVRAQQKKKTTVSQRPKAKCQYDNCDNNSLRNNFLCSKHKKLRDNESSSKTSISRKKSAQTSSQKLPTLSSQLLSSQLLSSQPLQTLQHSQQTHAVIESNPNENNLCSTIAKNVKLLQSSQSNENEPIRINLSQFGNYVTDYDYVIDPKTFKFKGKEINGIVEPLHSFDLKLISSRYKCEANANDLGQIQLQ